jgi:hypothetical protein
VVNLVSREPLHGKIMFCHIKAEGGSTNPNFRLPSVGKGGTHRIELCTCSYMSETGVAIVKARAQPVYYTFGCKSLYSNSTATYYHLT